MIFQSNSESWVCCRCFDISKGFGTRKWWFHMMQIFTRKIDGMNDLINLYNISLNRNIINDSKLHQRYARTSLYLYCDQNPLIVRGQSILQLYNIELLISKTLRQKPIQQNHYVLLFPDTKQHSSRRLIQNTVCRPC